MSPLSNEDDNLESLQSMPEELDDGRQPSSGQAKAADDGTGDLRGGSGTQVFRPNFTADEAIGLNI